MTEHLLLEIARVGRHAATLNYLDKALLAWRSRAWKSLPLWEKSMMDSIIERLERYPNKSPAPVMWKGGWWKS